MTYKEHIGEDQDGNPIFKQYSSKKIFEIELYRDDNGFLGNDSVSVYDDNFLYSSSNDSLFIKDLVNWEYELSGDELTMISQIIWTNENGDTLPTYKDLMTLERL